ncbi:Protein of unknown function [Cotesia congregata]|uniref:Uncharacterized protein n=1 Tax=Cotesia congregata TaxID=51543 RepID=A0A8J2HBK4_COTCN|nr:Protein of unknown function [Cotesia congregata]
MTMFGIIRSIPDFLVASAADEHLSRVKRDITSELRLVIRTINYNMQKVRIIYQKILSPVKRLLLQKSSEARFATPVVCSFFESNINPENITKKYSIIMIVYQQKIFTSTSSNPVYSSTRSSSASIHCNGKLFLGIKKNFLVRKKFLKNPCSLASQDFSPQPQIQKQLSDTHLSQLSNSINSYDALSRS